MLLSLKFLSILSLVSVSIAAPAPSSTSSAPAATSTVPPATDDPNYPLWGPDSDLVPQPIRPLKGESQPLGATVIGPQNVPLELENPDLFAPPSTDNGDIPNFKWPMSLSHNRLSTGGWARQQNIDQMSIATEMAGVNMRLEPGAIREMHWHDTAEWAYVLKGDLRISVLTPEGQIYLGDVTQGDLWYFPPGNPHSIQAKNTTKDGAEFLLVFDSGSFSEDSTFLLTDWLAHVPKEVIAKNFQTDISAFDHIPSRELYIFPSTPPPENVDEDMVIPNNTPEPYTFALSKVNATKLQGGTVKVVDSRTFKVSKTIAVAEVTVEAGGMRELHWHPTQAEWGFYISGQGRMTSFAANQNAQTIDIQAGDITYVPPSYGHYIENTGNTTLHFLEIFKTDVFQDISLTQWLALTPHELVEAHLGISAETAASFSKVKQTVVGPN